MLFRSLTPSLRSNLKLSLTYMNPFLLQLLGKKDPLLDEVLSNPSKYQFQVIYTSVNENGEKDSLDKHSLFEDRYYFYPASLIKFPLALLALEKMTLLKDSGIGLQTKIISNTCSCDKETDSYVKKSINPCLGQFLREMMIMSNNDAYNLFFDFVGRDHFNTRICEMGFNGIVLKSRFSGCSNEQNRMSGGVRFLGVGDSLIYSVPCMQSAATVSIDSMLPIKAGIAYIEKGKKINKPKDYSETNYVSLSQAHQLLVSLFYPGFAPAGFSLEIDTVYKNALLQAMGSFPRELLQSAEDFKNIPDHYYKFFLDPASMKTADGNLRIYNKVGLASGFLSDVSYFVDSANGVRFFLSAAILAKKDGVINNGNNNYFDLGMPVLRKIGALIYQYELEKKRPVR